MKVSNKRLFAQNEVFDFFFCAVDDLKGSIVPDYLIVQPRNIREDLVSGVGILPVVDGRLGLVKIFRPALQGSFWEIPHGFLDENENEIDACVRELHEETGIETTSGDIEFLATVAPDSGVLGGLVKLYLARGSLPSSKVQHEIGLEDFSFFTKKETVELINSGRLVDSFSLVAIYKYFMAVGET